MIIKRAAAFGKILVCLITISMLTACGGGGGSASSTPAVSTKIVGDLLISTPQTVAGVTSYQFKQFPFVLPAATTWQLTPPSNLFSFHVNWASAKNTTWVGSTDSASVDMIVNGNANSTATFKIDISDSVGTTSTSITCDTSGTGVLNGGGCPAGGIVVDLTAGKVTFTGTSLSTGIISSGTLRFTPP